jgi:hypothetical protein
VTDLTKVENCEIEYGHKGVAYRLIPIYPTSASVQFERYVKRDTGRPPALTRGRRSARR